ncbi:hypothetical protein F3I16_17365 [Pseudomonas sp. L-22-4S-12]|uniref:hypothetical protein n=1 Tax=Pseudomonas sp. L-22-4S-12 TaxID=2610893 RepID=UPI00132BB43D|nr:hypothetical protein [Pseudomonas sp. L-22-4S-12]MWV17813.1 hypothetical protein [Pseudomonas sp. L-22-4S-12]
MEQANQNPQAAIAIDLGALPQQLEVPGFATFYEEHRQANEGSPLATILTFIGYGVLIVGVLTLIFGPESVMVNTFSGPDFFQMIQLYPGPIASLGFLIVSAATLLNGQKQLLTPEAYLLNHYPLEPLGELAEGQRLQVGYLGDSRFLLSGVVADEAAGESPAGA